MSNLNEIPALLLGAKKRPITGEAEVIDAALKSDKPFETLAKSCYGAAHICTNEERMMYSMGVLNAVMLFAAIRDSYTAGILEHMDKRIAEKKDTLSQIDYIVDVTDMLALLTSKGLVKEPEVTR